MIDKMKPLRVFGKKHNAFGKNKFQKILFSAKDS
jgi:hypothetical protein